MFKLAQDDFTVEWPVTIQVPSNGGKHNLQTFKAKFKVLPKDEYKHLMESGLSDEDLIREILVDWKDIKDSNGNDIEFSEEALKEVCKFQYVTNAIVITYLEMVNKRKLKN